MACLRDHPKRNDSVYTQAKNKTWKQRKSKPERFLARSEFKLTIIQAQTQSMRTRSKSRPELAIGPLACDRNQPCVRRKEKRRGSPSKTVELGGFAFCLGLPALIFLVILEQRCSLKNRRASISSFPSAELSISTFSPPYSKA